MKITGGRRTITSSCPVTGTIGFSKGLVSTIKHGAMGRDKIYIHGVWSDNDGGIGTFSAGKK